MISVIRDKAFLNDKAFASHGFFGKRGGVSTGIFSSLNCGVGSADDLGHVRENRARVATVMNIKPERLLTLHQIHSNQCLTVDESYDAIHNRPQADALVTDKPDLAIGILTADCAPVLFYGVSESGKPVIGAAHAGWGGALAGILENTVAAMQSLGVKPASLKASIGPCIGPESYEVQQEFAKPFLAQDQVNDRFFRPTTKPGHLMFDLPAYCMRRLTLAGVKNVSCRGLDTVFNEEDFFSYRRATHRTEPDYGRQVSAIVLKS